MKRRMAGITGARAALVWLALATAAAADDSTEIAGLISRLADPSFPAREQASGEILARGRKQPQEIENALVDAYRHSADPEIRFRSKSILTKHFMESIGYLGVAYQRSDLLNPGGEKPPGVTPDDLRQPVQQSLDRMCIQPVHDIASPTVCHHPAAQVARRKILKTLPRLNPPPHDGGGIFKRPGRISHQSPPPAKRVLRAKVLRAQHPQWPGTM